VCLFLWVELCFWFVFVSVVWCVVLLYVCLMDCFRRGWWWCLGCVFVVVLVFWVGLFVCVWGVCGFVCVVLDLGMLLSGGGWVVGYCVVCCV
jgi:hypothetical protein